MQPTGQLLGDAPVASTEYRTIQAIVLDRVRAAILSGRLGPGDRVPQDELAQQYGVSRMPVREALRVLEKEGLVELRPHRGAIVTALLPEDVSEIFEIRAMLEGRAAELAAPRLDGPTLARLRALHDELAASDADEERWLIANHAFHTAIYGACGWPRLQALIDQQRNVVRPYLRAAFALLARGAGARDEHRQILLAAEARDPVRLADLTVDHLRTTARGLAAYLERRRHR